MKLIASMLAVISIAVPAASASGSTPVPRLLGDGPHFRLTWQVRPSSILYTGDSSGILGGFDGTGIAHPGHLQWTTWTRQRATGSGANWIDDCNPGCSNGTFTAHAVRVEAFRAVRGHFTRLTLRYRYHGSRHDEVWGIRRVGGYSSYYIVALHK